MIIVHDSHVFHSFYVKSQQTLHFSYVVFFPQHLPPIEMLMGCALGVLEDGTNVDPTFRHVTTAIWYLNHCLRIGQVTWYDVLAGTFWFLIKGSD